MLPHIDPSLTLVFLSKVVEKVVYVRLSDHINRHHLLLFYQSAYRRHALDRDHIS